MDAGEAGGAGELEFVADGREDGGLIGDDGADEEAVVEAEVVGEEFGVGALVGGDAVAVEIDADHQGFGEDSVLVLDAFFEVGGIELGGGVFGGRG